MTALYLYDIFLSLDRLKNENQLTRFHFKLYTKNNIYILNTGKYTGNLQGTNVPCKLPVFNLS